MASLLKRFKSFGGRKSKPRERRATTNEAETKGTPPSREPPARRGSTGSQRTRSRRQSDVPSLRMVSSPGGSTTQKLLDKRNEDIVSRIFEPGAVSEEGLHLTTSEILSLRTILLGKPGHKKQKGLRKRQSLAHFDRIEVVARSRSEISHDLDDEVFDEMFAMFHDPQDSQTTRISLKQAATDIMRGHRAVRALSMGRKTTSESGQSEGKRKSTADESLEGAVSRVVQISNPEQMKAVKKHMETIDTWSEFDIWSLVSTLDGNFQRAALAVSIHVLKGRTNVLNTINVPHADLYQYLSSVCSSYLDVPYHSCLHGADVMQGLHCVFTRNGHHIQRKLAPIIHFGALMAALVHDIGHLGRTNAFLVATDHELALHYNDKSVLENMHIAKALELSTKPGQQIFRKLSKDARRRVRHLWIEVILDTDMAMHVQKQWELNRSLDQAAHDETEFNGFSDKNLINTLGLLLHSVDLSNPAKPRHIYMNWTNRVMEEFFAQSDAEVAQELPNTLPRRENCRLAQFQIGFIRFIRPFFESLDRVPGVDYSQQIEHLGGNLQAWEQQRRDSEVEADA